MDDTSTREVLTPRDCLRLLSSASIGRIVYTDKALPAVQPVAYTVEDDVVVARAAEGSKLVGAKNVVVAFEADDLDIRSHKGWAVKVVGYAREVSDPGRVSKLAPFARQAWMRTDEDRFIQVSIEMIDGWRVA